MERLHELEQHLDYTFHDLRLLRAALYHSSYANEHRGAGIGSVSAGHIGAHAIWISCLLLLAAFALMFIREDLEQNPLIEKDISAIRKETAEIDRTLKQELKEEQQELKENAVRKR